MNWLQQWRWFRNQPNSEANVKKVWQSSYPGMAHFWFYADKKQKICVGETSKAIRFNWIEKL